jgi:cytochrome c-type biogenesis protein CcmH
MLSFWIIAFVLILVVLALILPVLVRHTVNTVADANIEKREIFRQQFAELEQDKISGALDEAQYDAAKGELQRRLLDEVGDVGMITTDSSPDRRLALILLFVLPLLAALLYYQLGSPSSVMIPAVSPQALVAQPVGHSPMAGDLEPLLNSLKSKLDKKPDDGDGWALLARSYVELRQHAKAIPAYENAVKVISDDPQLFADYADALAVVNGHQLSGKPEELVNQALKLDPHHVKALMLAATAAFNRQNYKQAIGYWERLQQDLPAGSEMLPEVNASLDEARALSGGKVPTKSTSKPTDEKDLNSKAISGTVTISPKLVAKISPSATVFIFARATQGQPMPLAIVRTTVGNLPYTYHLDDSTALMPNNKLSLANEVVVVARASKAGDAKQQAGDLQGVSATLKPEGQNVDIEINQVLP